MSAGPGVGREAMARIRAARRRGDDGVSLLLALALVIGVGVIVGAVLTYAGTSLSAMQGADLAQRAYDVDGALQTAVDVLRHSTYDQDETRPAVGCFAENPRSDVLTVPGGSGDVAVRCTPKAGTGAASGKVPINENNRLADAIYAGTKGVHQHVRAAVLVGGDVRSQEDVHFQGGPACPDGAGYPGGGTACGGLWVQGEVHADGSCGETVVSLVGVKECGPSVPEPPAEASPAPSSTTEYRKVPACTAGEAHLRPGSYDDAAALSKLTSGCPELERLVIEPGTYFFDFRNKEAAEPDSSLPFDAGENTWKIDNPNLEVIGGSDTTFGFMGQACASPMKSTGAWGVRMVFGGTSRLNVTSGKVSLCGTYSAAQKPIVVQGSTVDQVQGVPVTTLPGAGESGAMNAAGDPTGGGFSPSGPEALARAVSYGDDEPPKPGASATIDFTRQPTGPQTLWATFTGYFEGVNAIPAGAILTEAKLNFKHRERDHAPGDALRITFDPGPGDPLEPTSQPILRSDLTTDSVDLLSDELIASVHDNGLDAGTLRYELTSAAGSGNIGAEIDLATLSFSWTPPVLRKQTAGTRVLSTSGSDTRFRVDGAISVPEAEIRLDLDDVDYLVVSGGLVAEHVELAIEPKDGFGRAVIQTPKLSDGPKPLEVYLVAYTCPGGACGSPPPANGWEAVGTAAATFKGPALPDPDRRVELQSWHLEP